MEALVISNHSRACLIPHLSYKSHFQSKYSNMEHKKKLEELHQESLQKLQDYMKSKGELREEDHARLQQAKDDWNAAWTKLMEALMVLERLEI